MKNYLYGIDVVSGALDDTYEMKAQRDGFRYFGQNPNASGEWGKDEAGTPVFNVKVPGWHFFSDYDKWFRDGYTKAKQGRNLDSI